MIRLYEGHLLPTLSYRTFDLVYGCSTKRIFEFRQVTVIWNFFLVPMILIETSFVWLAHNTNNFKFEFSLAVDNSAIFGCVAVTQKVDH